jgi:hypothetical protein
MDVILLSCYTTSLPQLYIHGQPTYALPASLYTIGPISSVKVVIIFFFHFHCLLSLSSSISCPCKILIFLFYVTDHVHSSDYFPFTSSKCAFEVHTTYALLTQFMLCIACPCFILPICSANAVPSLAYSSCIPISQGQMSSRRIITLWGGGRGLTALS